VREGHNIDQCVAVCCDVCCDALVVLKKDENNLVKGCTGESKSTSLRLLHIYKLVATSAYENLSSYPHQCTNFGLLISIFVGNVRNL